MTYNDITYCSRECANMECKRNQKHLPKGPKIISMAEFKDCENWKEIDADFMFEALGYSKQERGEKIVYIKDDSEIIFNKELRYFVCEDDFGSWQYVTMAELKAINKKCQELGWE